MTAKDFVTAIAAACSQTEAPGAADAKQHLAKYVSHLVYLEGNGAPAVDVEELGRLGIKCVRVASRQFVEGKTVTFRYAEAALGEALESIIDS